MRVPINEIKVTPGRRAATPGSIRDLADSIAEIGLLNPVTINQDHTLIAGLHRLEAAKLLGWTEIECVVIGLDGLRAELAEIDENFVRSDLTPIEFGELLLRRKEIYETLHPETKNGGDRKSHDIRTSKCRSDSAKPFTQDTAEKLGVSRSTVERQVRIARNLTPETKDIIWGSNALVTRKDALALSRLEPGPQAEAASLLAAGKIQSVKEYAPPVRAGPSVPQLTAGDVAAEAAELARLLQRAAERCEAAPITQLSPAQIANFRRQMAAVRDAIQKIEQLLEGKL